MKLRILAHISFLLLMLSGCVPADVEPLTDVSADVKSSDWQRVYNFQDKHEIDSLLSFTSHPDPTYRYMVGSGLASQTSSIKSQSMVRPTCV